MSPSQPQRKRTTRPRSLGERGRVVLEHGPLEFPIYRSSRRTIGLSIAPEEGLRVTAPARASQREIETAVREKAGWIHRHLAALESRVQARPTCAYREGACILYRGELVPLALPSAIQLAFAFARADGRVRFDGAAIVLDGFDSNDPAAIRLAIEGWLRAEARRLLPPRVWHYAQRFGQRPTRVLLSDAQTRWGSLGSHGSIRLNWRLILAPPEVADYVAAHEVCHLRHPHHRASFWRALEELDPEWRAHRAQLRMEGHQYELPPTSVLPAKPVRDAMW